MGSANSAGPARRGELFIVAAPTGAGLTALVDRTLASDPDRFGGLHRAVAHTTRRRREGEVDGRDYHFVDRRRFERLVEQERILEWTEHNANLYGTSRDEVSSRLERGVDVLIETDPRGAERLRESCPQARTVLVTPGGSAVSSSEIRLYDRYDCVIIHDDAKRASGVLAATLLDKSPSQGPAGPRSRR